MYSIQKIHQHALSVAKQFLQNQVALIEILVQVIEHQVHQHLGYSSVFEYCTTELKLSSDQACSFIGIARKSIEIPEIKNLVQEGELTISNARRIVPHIDKRNKDFWLERATSLSQRDLEKEIVRVKPAAAVKEQVKPVAENLSSLLILIQDQDEQLWNRAQELLLQKRGRKIEKREILVAALQALLDKEDPLKRAARIENREAKKRAAMQPASSRAPSQEPDVPTIENETSTDVSLDNATFLPHRSHHLSPTFTRSKIPAPVLRQVNLRDLGQCTHHHNAKRCESRAFLEFHHLLPISMGGKHTAENLVTLCSSHHRFVHRNL